MALLKVFLSTHPGKHGCGVSQEGGQGAYRGSEGLERRKNWRERAGKQGKRSKRQVPAHFHLPLSMCSQPLLQPGHFGGLSEDRVPIWPWRQGELPLLLESGADGVCRAGVPEQWGLEWNGAHLPP